MDRRPPVLAPSALGNRPPVQNWIEEEQGSIILRSGTVSEAPYIRIATPKIRIPPKPCLPKPVSGISSADGRIEWRTWEDFDKITRIA